MSYQKYDYLIVGAGMVGMCIAHQLNIKEPKKKICVLEKEKTIGLHSSGRNSGVLHAGIYYKPDSLKARLCIEGSRRLKEWCKNENIKVIDCGKVITPQEAHLDFQLDNLLERGKQNGATVEIINQDKFNQLVPNGRTASGRALWSPKTSIVNPKEVIKKLYESLLNKNVEFLFNIKILKYNSDDQTVDLINTKSKLEFNFKFEHFFNCAGLQSDKIGRLFNIGKDYRLLPFKGIYWKLRQSESLFFDTNLYPVPDLKMPFLGVHVTPSIDKNIYLGPTAIPALGAENYYGLSGVEILNSLNNFSILASQWFNDKNNFRNYASEQAILGIKYFFFKSAKLLIPKLKISDILSCEKVGIRPQLFDYKKNKLIDDFIIKNTYCSTHVLNAISPAFTASFSFADYVIKK